MSSVFYNYAEKNPCGFLRALPVVPRQRFPPKSRRNVRYSLNEKLFMRHATAKRSLCVFYCSVEGWAKLLGQELWDLARNITNSVNIHRVSSVVLFCLIARIPPQRKHMSALELHREPRANREERPGNTASGNC